MGDIAHGVVARVIVKTIEVMASQLAGTVAPEDRHDAAAQFFRMGGKLTVMGATYIGAVFTAAATMLVNATTVDVTVVTEDDGIPFGQN